jgi:hypothetical protein
MRASSPIRTSFPKPLPNNCAGRFSLKGVGADQEIFAPVSPAAPG